MHELAVVDLFAGTCCPTAEFRVSGPEEFERSPKVFGNKYLYRDGRVDGLTRGSHVLVERLDQKGRSVRRAMFIESYKNDLKM